jgi:hypothetical protein
MGAYPGSFYTWIDNSAIPSIPEVTTVNNAPLFGGVFTSDIGPEDWTTVSGTDFFDLYGNSISFAKHGQPLLQAAAMIQNGAKLYCKRVVAPDSTLANLGVLAKVSAGKETEVQETNDDGEALYYQMQYTGVAVDPTTASLEDGTVSATTTKTTSPTTTLTVETTDSSTKEFVVDNTPCTETVTTNEIAYEKYSLEGATSSTEIINDFKSKYVNDPTDDSAEKVFPLFVIIDNGRGVSSKTWQIVPDYENSKNATYMVYRIGIGANSKTSSVTFTFNPDYILDGTSFSLKSRLNNATKQVICEQNDTYIAEFVDAVASILGVTYADLANQDVLFGYNRKGEVLSDALTYNTDDIDLSDAIGNLLENGSNGSFGKYPVTAGKAVKSTAADANGASVYDYEMAQAFDEDKYPEIYDVENNKFIAIVDANYPELVKKTIEKLAMAREDFVYFRDMGFVARSLADIKAYMANVDNDSEKGVDNPTKFVKLYHNFFDIIDPYTKKQITVTATYLIGIKLINHYINGINRPFAGQRYGITFPEIISGTINYLPSVTPSRNEKQEIVDLRVNYIGYYNELAVLETDYTLNDEYTQLSFGCNVMAVQAVMRAIRTRCPQIRYTLATEDGLMEYKRDIEENVLSDFTNWFDTLNFTYVGDEITLANKQYYGALEFKFTDWIQSEYFTLTALPSVSASE